MAQPILQTENIRVLPLTCHGHSRPITHVNFTPLLDSEQYYLISSAKDNNPMLRSGMTGDWIGTFLGHKGAVWQSRISLDGLVAVTASADFTAKVWDAQTGEVLHTLQHNHMVRSIALPSAPGTRSNVVATGGMEKKIRIYDLNQSNATANNSNTSTAYVEEIGTDQHQGSIRSITWSPTNPFLLISACEDKKIRWWDLRTKSAIGTFDLDGPLGTCELDRVGTQGSSTLSVAAGKTVYFFEPDTPASLIKRVDTPYEIASVALNGKDGKFVTGHSNDTWVREWNFDTGKETAIGKGHHGPVWACSFAPDGKLYATGSEDGTIKLWKSTEGPYSLWK